LADGGQDDKYNHINTMDDKKFFENITKNNFQNDCNPDVSKPDMNFDPDKKPKKSYWKFTLSFLAVMFVALFGYPIVKNVYYSYVAENSINDTLQMQAQYLDALKSDTFGGKTPQETYEKFVATLKNGNILDAAKFYMRDEDRISAYKKFDDMQKSGSLENWIAELPNWSVMKEVEYWDPDGKEFQYEKFREKDVVIDDLLIKGEKITLPAGEYTGAIIFEINKSANIWKIYEL